MFLFVGVCVFAVDELRQQFLELIHQRLQLHHQQLTLLLQLPVYLRRRLDNRTRPVLLTIFVYNGGHWTLVNTLQQYDKLD